MASFPADWEELLWEAVRAEVGSGAVQLQALVPAIHARTRRYTDARERLGEKLRGREADLDLAARALFFTVADAAKIAVPLAELERRGLLPIGPVRVLDVGAGAGAMTLGLANVHPTAALDVTAVDRDARALAILRRVAASLPRPLDATTRVADVTAVLPDGPFDLIVAGTVLNELPAVARLPLVVALLERLAGGGSLILVEPALRETSRALHSLRDELLAGGRAHVFAPCTHERPCPALADERDWCHEDRRFDPPPRLAALMHRTGLRDGGLKFAYLTLRLIADRQVDGAKALRVVSGPLDTKGVVERIVCGDDGRRHLRILRRERGESLRTLADSDRGDVLVEDDAGGLSVPTTPVAPSETPPRTSPP